MPAARSRITASTTLGAASARSSHRAVAPPGASAADGQPGSGGAVARPGALPSASTRTCDPPLDVDQPRGHPGQHGGAPHQGSSPARDSDQPIEVGDHPDGRTGIRIQRGKASGQLFHTPMVLGGWRPRSTPVGIQRQKL